MIVINFVVRSLAFALVFAFLATFGVLANVFLLSRSFFLTFPHFVSFLSGNRAVFATDIYGYINTVRGVANTAFLRLFRRGKIEGGRTVHDLFSFKYGFYGLFVAALSFVIFRTSDNIYNVITDDRFIVLYCALFVITFFPRITWLLFYLITFCLFVVLSGLCLLPLFISSMTTTVAKTVLDALNPGKDADVTAEEVTWIMTMPFNSGVAAYEMYFAEAGTERGKQKLAVGYKRLVLVVLGYLLIGGVSIWTMKLDLRPVIAAVWAQVLANPLSPLLFAGAGFVVLFLGYIWLNGSRASAADDAV
jgi:hypothetical protein